MERARTWLLLLSVAFAAVSAQRPAAAQNPLVEWVIIGGGSFPASKRAIGLTLNALAATPQLIQPSANPVTDASGQVFVGPFLDCPHVFHFHGSLDLGKGVESDNGRGCGWGVVLPLGAVPRYARELAGAIDQELEALSHLKQPLDLDGAKISAHVAQTYLKDTRVALERANEDGDISDKVFAKLEKHVDRALKSDELAEAQIDKAIAGGGARPVAKAVSALKKGLDSKQAAFKILSLDPDPPEAPGSTPVR
jgi:hypothetical protein